MWCTKWHWDRFLPQYFGFPLSVSFQCCSIFTYVSSGGMDKGSSSTDSLSFLRMKGCCTERLCIPINTTAGTRCFAAADRTTRFYFTNSLVQVVVSCSTPSALSCDGARLGHASTPTPRNVTAFEKYEPSPNVVMLENWPVSNGSRRQRVRSEVLAATMSTSLCL